jgi:hypothetical protein
MKNILLATALLALVAAPSRIMAAMSPSDAVMVPVDQFLDGFNAGNTKEMLAVGAPLGLDSR